MDDTTKRHMLLTDDPKLNYMCGYEKEIETIVTGEKKIIDIGKVDYMIDTVDDEPQPELPDIEDNLSDTSNIHSLVYGEDKTKTLSYLSVKSVEEGIDWYRKEYPKVPEELIPMMARWSWGNLNDVTKKEIKNNIKKQRKKEAKQKGLVITKKPVVVTFD